MGRRRMRRFFAFIRSKLKRHGRYCTPLAPVCTLPPCKATCPSHPGVAVRLRACNLTFFWEFITGDGWLVFSEHRSARRARRWPHQSPTCSLHDDRWLRPLPATSWICIMPLPSARPLTLRHAEPNDPSRLLRFCWTSKPGLKTSAGLLQTLPLSSKTLFIGL